MTPSPFPCQEIQTHEALCTDPLWDTHSPWGSYRPSRRAALLLTLANNPTLLLNRSGYRLERETPMNGLFLRPPLI